MNREIILYTTENGDCPVKGFLDSLPGNIFKKVTWVLTLVSELERIPVTYFKKLKNGDDIWECRIQFGSNIYRLFCFFANDSIIVLTHGLIKKTQKTPKNEIKKAIKYKNDYMRRMK
ncbi:MAG: type II toxin-antitoxin system RelE/ParE family toxin [bacterium]|nr:type II toxin-antitoxin system RelE/ParE family toxin [bacterium]